MAPIPGKGDYSYWPSDILFPQVPIPVFERPHGELLGRLIRTIRSDNNCRIDILLSPHADEPVISVDQTRELEFVQCGYDQYALKIYQRQDGYVQVLRETYGENAWIRVADLELTGYLAIDYIDLLVRKEERTTGIPLLRDSEITLREQPGFSSRQIMKIPAEEAFYFSMDFTGRVAGTWAEVIVEYSDERCGDFVENPLYPHSTSFSGWIKVIDQQGFPNVWYDTEGC